MLILMVMAFAHPSSAVELFMEDSSGAPGEDVYIAVLIDDEGDTLSAGFTLGYDPQILTATGVETTSLTSGFMVAHAIKWEHIAVALGGDTAVTGRKEALVKVTFSISENATVGKTTITLSNPTVYDSDYQAKETIAFNGTVIISETANWPCPVTVIYGEHSEEAALLRYLRDNVLNQSPEGQELISMYYQWSSTIVEAMEEDQEFMKDIKETIESVLPLIKEVK